MGGGNTQTPITPVAYLERDERPAGRLLKGLEVINTGQRYWADSYAKAVELAEADGHDLSH